MTTIAVTSLEDIVGSGPTKMEVEKKELQQTKKPHKPESVIPRGKPKSGKFWKVNKQRFSSLNTKKGLVANTLAKKEKLRADLKHAKELSRSRLEERKKEIEAKKERRRENLKRREENRKKSEIVQVIRNPAKIKRMRKKQLRMIEKRDTTNM